MLAQRLLLTALILLQVVLANTHAQQTTSVAALELQGDIRFVHDPSIIKAGDTYHLFSTRAGISERCSIDLIHWSLCGDVFAHLPLWAVQDVVGVRGLWAPDISYFNGLYHLYYSVSTFGKNRSSIGLVTNEDLDPSSAKYRWMDQGKVISSYPADDWNAIDPNLVIDAEGQPWLSFGSFWSGIKLRRIDRTTGKLDSRDQNLYSLASRPRATGQPGAIEAPFIARRNGYYYLFVSFDFCCRGKDSTYNIRVGRSRRVTGPYLDRDGVDMREGGGTLLLEGSGRWRGPGHCALLQEQVGDKLIYHAYDADFRGISTLRISPLLWDKESWPMLKASTKS
jgi:arabinan endo-1,5-alpha-L-arabinosidase